MVIRLELFCELVISRGVSWGGFGAPGPRVTKRAPKKEEKGKGKREKREKERGKRQRGQKEKR